MGKKAKKKVSPTKGVSKFEEKKKEKSTTKTTIDMSFIEDYARENISVQEAFNFFDISRTAYKYSEAKRRLRNKITTLYNALVTQKNIRNKTLKTFYELETERKELYQKLMRDNTLTENQAKEIRERIKEINSELEKLFPTIYQKMAEFGEKAQLCNRINRKTVSKHVSDDEIDQLLNFKNEIDQYLEKFNKN